MPPRDRAAALAEAQRRIGRAPVVPLAITPDEPPVDHVAVQFEKARAEIFATPNVVVRFPYNTVHAMAGRLSHELRTPVAVVRSSLDNLKAQALPAEARVYVERAGEGVDRLARLISRLSEATRLERMLEAPERESFDLVKLVEGCVEGYRSAHPQRRFEFAHPNVGLEMSGVPDAIAQALDKLVENALDFGVPEQPIQVALALHGRRVVLSVTNQGPLLPDGAEASLFESLVTHRPATGRREEHLGLGLYIVRLVAEAHGGRARAENLLGKSGVRFEVELLLP
jgi:signal transduction histidine kinase